MPRIYDLKNFIKSMTKFWICLESADKTWYIFCLAETKYLAPPTCSFYPSRHVLIHHSIPGKILILVLILILGIFFLFQNCYRHRWSWSTMHTKWESSLIFPNSWFIIFLYADSFLGVVLEYSHVTQLICCWTETKDLAHLPLDCTPLTWSPFTSWYQVKHRYWCRFYVDRNFLSQNWCRIFVDTSVHPWR